MTNGHGQISSPPPDGQSPGRKGETDLEKFNNIFGVWDEANSSIHMMVDDEEMKLVVLLGDRALTVEQISELNGLTEVRGKDLLQRAYARCILNKKVEDGITRYSAADFYSRLNQFVKYENWEDIPVEDRREINQRFLNEFIARHKPTIERKMRGLEAENALPNDTVMLLNEVEEMINSASEIVVQPCDCRKLGENCDFPVETCIWLDDGARESLDRGQGRRLTKEEAVELLRWADKKGLMHTADSEWKSRGLHAICNCCSCDCYPFQAAQELGSKGFWPKSNYVAAYKPELCNLCGACVKRCHFEAFYHNGSMLELNGKNKKGVGFEMDKCWGCGLCANTCPENAITMIALDELMRKN